MLRQTPNIDAMLLSELVRMEGSGLHLKVGAPPAVRVHGLLEHLEDYEVLRPVETEGILKDILPQKLVEDFEEEFEEEGEAAFAHPVAGVGRFRVNAFRHGVGFPSPCVSSRSRYRS